MILLQDMRISSNREFLLRNVPTVPATSYIARGDSLEGHLSPLHRPQIGKFQVGLRKS